MLLDLILARHLEVYNGSSVIVDKSKLGTRYLLLGIIESYVSERGSFKIMQENQRG